MSKEFASFVVPESLVASAGVTEIKVPYNCLNKEESKVWLKAVMELYQPTVETTNLELPMGPLQRLTWKLKFAIRGQGAFKKYVIGKKKTKKKRKKKTNK